MSDNYQIGSDLEWLKHSNQELSRLVKKRQRQLAGWRGFSLLLLLALGWVLYKFLQKFPLEELLRL